MYEKGSCFRRHSESQGHGKHGLELRVRGWVGDKSNRATRVEWVPQATQIENLRAFACTEGQSMSCATFRPRLAAESMTCALS